MSEENQLPGDDMETLAWDHSWTTNGIKSRTLKSRVVSVVIVEVEACLLTPLRSGANPSGRP